MKYGLPYQGSKNSIAEWVVDILPRGEILVDLFCGGGAVTHAAMLRGKYKRYIMNDINKNLPVFFTECIKGKHTIRTHPEWVSRAEFNEKKHTDIYTALIWSFGNNGQDYLYGAGIEPFKKAYHYACMYKDTSLFSKLGIIVPEYKDIEDPVKRKLAYISALKAAGKEKNYLHLQNLEHLERLQRFERLKNLRRPECYGLDYQALAIPKGAVIYADPPYNNTKCGMYNGFDGERFYRWARAQENIFISEYDMPADFIELARIEKYALSAAGGNRIKKLEKIYTNERTYKKINKSRLWTVKTFRQLNLFDI